MRVLAIVSGGLDSTVMAFKLKAEGNELVLVNFSYGSKHNFQERERARMIYADAGLDLGELNIDLRFLGSALTDHEEAVPHGAYDDQNQRRTVVPFRNGIMLAYAVALAEEKKCEAVAYGAHGGDHAIYPDCRPEFVTAF